MSQENIEIIIQTNNFMSLNKRLLLQPLSFKVQEIDGGCKIEITSEGAVGNLMHHIANTVNEEIVADVIDSHFAKQGIYPEWARARVIPQFNLDEMDGAWRDDLLNDIAGYVNQAIETGQPLKLNAYLNFGTADARSKVHLFADSLEELTFYSVIERSLSVTGSDSPDHDVPTVDTVTVEMLGNKLRLLAGEEEIVSVDVASKFSGVYAESIYFPNSKRYEEVQLYTYLLMIMNRWAVQEWVVPTSMYKTLELYRQRLDIHVEVTENAQ